MPLYPDAVALITFQLQSLERGERVALIAIGELTEDQFSSLNKARAAAQLPAVDSKEIVYLGRHHFSSRRAQGYALADMVSQISTAVADHATPIVTRKGTVLESGVARDDGYGNQVRDQAILELTARKPRVEVFSVIPKGDRNPPKTTKPR
jgi:hypothetical protein